MHTSKTRTRSLSNILRWCCVAATEASKLAGQGHSEGRRVIVTFGNVSGFMENKIRIIAGSFRFFPASAFLRRFGDSTGAHAAQAVISLGEF